jgi:hypothetical protein
LDRGFLSIIIVNARNVDSMHKIRSIYMYKIRSAHTHTHIYVYIKVKIKLSL